MGPVVGLHQFYLLLPLHYNQRVQGVSEESRGFYFSFGDFIDSGEVRRDLRYGGEGALPAALLFAGA